MDTASILTGFGGEGAKSDTMGHLPGSARSYETNPKAPEVSVQVWRPPIAGFYGSKTLIVNPTLFLIGQFEPHSPSKVGNTHFQVKASQPVGMLRPLLPLPRCVLQLWAEQRSLQ